MSSIANVKTLVLTNQYLPVSVCPLHMLSGEDAMKRWSKNPSDVILFHDRKVLTQNSDDIFWPSIIVNPTNNVIKNEVKLWKDNILYREDWKCFFCGDPIGKNTMTYDHYIPQKENGKKEWENVVAACSKCNHLKGCNPPTGKWQGNYKPYEPTYHDLVKKRMNYPIEIWDERWLYFIPVWNSDVIVRSPFDGSIVRVIEMNKG